VPDRRVKFAMALKVRSPPRADLRIEPVQGRVWGMNSGSRRQV
jgi:hypothetical protein